jgi:hypothetical protein
METHIPTQRNRVSLHFPIYIHRTAKSYCPWLDLSGTNANSGCSGLRSLHLFDSPLQFTDAFAEIGLCFLF